MASSSQQPTNRFEILFKSKLHPKIIPNRFIKASNSSDYITLGPIHKGGYPSDVESNIPIPAGHQLKIHEPFEVQSVNGHPYPPIRTWHLKDDSSNIKAMPRKDGSQILTVNQRYHAWYLRLKPHLEETWRRQEVNNFLELTTKSINPQFGLLVSAGLFWTPCLNGFAFRPRLLSFSLKDISALCGLSLLGEPPNMKFQTSEKETFTDNLNIKAWETFIDENMTTKGKPKDQEISSFWLFVLSRFFLSLGSSKITLTVAKLAAQMATGKRVALAPLFLGLLFHGMFDWYQCGLSGNPSGPLWFVQLWLYCYFPDLLDDQSVFEITPLGKLGSALADNLPQPKPLSKYMHLFYTSNASIHWDPFPQYPKDLDSDYKYLPLWELKVTDEESVRLWSCILTPRDLFSGVVVHKKKYFQTFIEQYNPQLFQKQFGLVQTFALPIWWSFNQNPMEREPLSVEDYHEILAYNNSRLSQFSMPGTMLYADAKSDTKFLIWWDKKAEHLFAEKAEVILAVVFGPHWASIPVTSQFKSEYSFLVSTSFIFYHVLKFFFFAALGDVKPVSKKAAGKRKVEEESLSLNSVKEDTPPKTKKAKASKGTSPVRQSVRQKVYTFFTVLHSNTWLN